MKLSEFKSVLGNHQEKNLQFILPTGNKIPLHAHVTDVARVEKKFIDCGGTLRTETHCSLQAWFAEDTDHRINARILLKILGKAVAFLESDDLEMEIEYEAPFISKFPISTIEIAGQILIIRLAVKHTACLAPDICIPPQIRSIFDFKPLPVFPLNK
jgi:hypothetical protein